MASQGSLALSRMISPMRPQRWLLVGFMLALCGCGSISLKEYTKVWIGHPIAEKRQPMLREGLKETTYPLDNGNWVDVEPAGVGGKDCLIHWEVNSQGIIVGAHTEGKGCPSISIR